MKTDTDDSANVAINASAAEMSEAEIDDNLEDTFPASDPPAWTLGTNHRSDTQQEQESGNFKDD